MKLIAIAAASTLLMLGTAHAQLRAPAGAYGELGYTQFKIGDDAGGGDVKPGAIRGIVGYNVHPNAAVEGMLAFGVKDDDDAKLKHAIGLYVKPKVDIANNFELFGRLGYTRAKTEGNGGPGIGSISDSEGGFSYGLGANFRFAPNAYVGADFMRYFKKDGVKLEGFTVGVGFRF
jgi:opacity protein-like surface antigen